MTRTLDADLEAHRAAFLRDPRDPVMAVGLAARLERSGDASGAFGVLDAAYERSPSEEVATRRRALWATDSCRGDPRVAKLPRGADPKGAAAIASLAFDGSASRLAVGSRGGDLWIHDEFKSDGASDRSPPPWKRGRVPRGVSSLTFSPDGSQLITGGGDQSVRVWEAAAESKGVVAARDLEGYVFAVASYRGGLCGATEEWLWVKDSDGSEHRISPELHASATPTREWCTAAGARAAAKRVSYGYGEESGAVHRTVFPGLDGHIVESETEVVLVSQASAHSTGLLFARGVEVVDSSGEIHAYRHPDLFPASRSFMNALPVAALAPSGRWLLLGSIEDGFESKNWKPPYNEGARLFFLGAEVKSYPLAEESTVTAVAFSPCGHRFALGASDGDVFLGSLSPSPS